MILISIFKCVRFSASIKATALVSLFFCFKFVWSTTLLIEATQELPVSKQFLIDLEGSWLKHRLPDIDKIESTLFLKHEDGNDRTTVVTAIPGPTGNLRPNVPDYVVRKLAWPACMIVVNSSKTPDYFDFDCSLETSAIVRARADCASQGGTWDAPRNMPKGHCVQDQERKCVESGRKWTRVLRNQHLTCVKTYPDGGKECTDSSQCMGRCQAWNFKTKSDGTVVGTCESEEPVCTIPPTVSEGKLFNVQLICD